MKAFFFVFLHIMNTIEEKNTPESSSTSLRQRTARGLMWGVVNNGSMQLLGALFGVVLMNLLTQVDYGKVAMLTIFTQIASTLQESGFTQALCNLERPTHRDYNAVFWFNIGMSAILYIILFFSAPLIVWFYNDPSLLWLSRYLFLGFFFSSWGCVQRAWMFINMKNRESAIIVMVAMLVSSSVNVWMAWQGYGYWSLATQTVLFILVISLMNWHFSPWRPTLHIDLRPAFRLFGFSGKLLLTNLFNTLNAHVFSVLLGRFYGDQSVGTYSQARKWTDMGANTVNGMVSGVAQPVLTQVRADQERYRNVFRKMLRFVCFVSFPAMLGLSLVAHDFLYVISGTKWLSSARLMSLLCVYGAFVPVSTLYAQLTISMGRSGVNFFSTVALCTLIWLGLILLRPLGIEMMVLFFISINVLWLAVWQWWAHRLIGLRWTDALLRDILPFLLLSIGVMAAAWWVTLPIAQAWLSLMVKMTVAAILYIGLLWVAKAKILRESFRYLRHKDARD